MKYTKIDEPVFITYCREEPSRFGGYIWRLCFKGIKTQKDYHTYVDAANKNFRNWDHIITIANLKGIVLTNLRHQSSDGLVTADSIPEIEVVVSQEELADQLADYWYGNVNSINLDNDKGKDTDV